MHFLAQETAYYGCFSTFSPLKTRRESILTPQNKELEQGSSDKFKNFIKFYKKILDKIERYTLYYGS
jgi:hypothetical protein